MFATSAELETHLGLDFTVKDHARAEQLLAGIDGRVRIVGGVDRAAAIEADEESPAFAAVRDVVLAIAARRFANPEAVMQKRMGGDYSVSFADSSEAATGLTRDERAAILAAFKTPAGWTTTL